MKSQGGENTVKSLNEINREFQLETVCRRENRRAPAARRKNSISCKPPPKAKTRWIHYISDTLYFMALGLVIFEAMTLSSKTGGPRMFFGYSYLTVLTSSMQSEIPRGSLILLKQTDADSIRVGDDITYMRDESTSVTHKVIQIYEDFQGSGKRGFETKGVNNLNPDAAVVYASNVVGVVIFHVPYLGAILSYIGENMFMVFVIFGLFMLLSFTLRLLFNPPVADRKRRKASRRAGAAAVRKRHTERRTAACSHAYGAA